MPKKENMNQKLGVIGGLGTETAAQFYVEAERLWHAAGEKSHIPLLLENIQSSFSLEQSLAESPQRISELKTFLCQATASLERGGSSLIVLPCNTAHVHIQSLREFAQVPLLSITEEVAKEVASHGVHRAAILGTRVTRESGIYDGDCQRHGIDTMYPLAVDQRAIEGIIQRTLSWTNDATDTQKLLEVIEHVLTAGAEAVVLACTDLQLCMPDRPVAKVFDSMKVLANASVARLRQL